MAKVLLVDDEMTMVQMVTELLRSDGHQVAPFNNGQLAIEALHSIGPELIIANLCSDRVRAFGLSLIQKARTLNPPAVAIMLTSPGLPEAGVEALKKGAFDCLNRPFTLDEFRLRIERALSYHSVLSENVCLRRQVQSKFQFSQLIGTSAKMVEVLKVIERIADTDSSIFICGQSGTGKELVARAVHFNSRRRFAPFVSVSCNVLADHLLELELFGFRKVAVGSNPNERAGLFQEADGGTLLLDHIGALSASMQARLLRVLQDREVRRVGDSVATAIDVRILACNEVSLEQQVMAGAFREDLYRGLNIIPISLPPLAERPEDIPLLISHFLEGKSHPRNGQAYEISREAVDACCAFTWPGNVRELENAIARACVLAENGTVRVNDLPEAVQRLGSIAEPSMAGGKRTGMAELVNSGKERGMGGVATLGSDDGIQAQSNSAALLPLKQFLRSQELTYLHRTLSLVGGSKERAAELLGISLATIYRKLSDVDEA